MKSQNKKIAFTLIELLVVITIIGILAVWATTIFSSQIQKARDSKRTTNIAELKWYIEQAYQDEAVYPDSTSGSGFSGSIGKYTQNMPTDPKSWTACYSWSSCDYLYVSGTKDGIAFAAFEVSTAYENVSNINSTATNETDNWNDANRFEAWLELDTLNTKGSWAISSKNWCEVYSWSIMKIADTWCFN